MKARPILTTAMLVAAAIAAQPAAAVSVTYFNSSAAFNSATSARATDSFNVADLTPTLDKFFGVTRIVGPYSYSLRGLPGGAATTIGSTVYLSGGTGGSLQFRFEQPVRAVALRVLTLTDAGEFPAPGSNISLSFGFNTSAESGNYIADNVDVRGFHGFTSDVDLTGLQISAFVPGGTMQGAWVSSVTFAEVGGSAGGIPEPATWGLLIAGFGAIGIAARRRREADCPI